MATKREGRARAGASRARDAASKALGEFIRGQRRLARLSVRELAKLADISNPYLSQVERGIYRPSAEVLKALANALNISAETLYARIGLLEPNPDEDLAPSVEEAIRRDPRLNEEQKRTLIDVYRAFLGASDEA